MAAPDDVIAVGELLGRQPRGAFEVVVRSADGTPVVVRNAPLLDDGTPMPTRYWLVGRAEIAASSTGTPSPTPTAATPPSATRRCPRTTAVHDLTGASPARARASSASMRTTRGTSLVATTRSGRGSRST
jgi:hypothetical protein